MISLSVIYIYIYIYGQKIDRKSTHLPRISDKAVLNINCHEQHEKGK
jgi:hypothetical protein